MLVSNRWTNLALSIRLCHNGPMKLSVDTLRNSSCPRCKKDNKIVYFGNCELKNPTDIKCVHCGNRYQANDAVYYFDEEDDCVISLSRSDNPDSKETLRIDGEVELQVVDNKSDFISAASSKMNELNHKVVIVMARIMAKDLVNTYPDSIGVDAYLTAEFNSTLMFRFHFSFVDGTWTNTHKGFDLDLYLDIHKTIKDIVEDNSCIFRETEANAAYLEYMNRKAGREV